MKLKNEGVIDLQIEKTASNNDLDLNLEATYTEFLKSRKQQLLHSLIDQQSPFLVDYILRMTGSVGSAEETVRETKSAMKYDIVRRYDYSQFRVRLFMTVRSFCAELWNSDTSYLSLRHFTELNLENDLRFQEAFMSMQGRHREVFLLSAAYNFSLEDAARIFGVGEKLFSKNIQEAFLAYKSILRRNYENTPELTIESTFEMVGEFSLLKIPDSITKIETAALSQIIAPIAARFSWRKIRLYVYLLSAAALAAALLYERLPH